MIEKQPRAPNHQSIRRIVLICTVAFSVIVYGLVLITIPDGILQTIRLGQWYGFLGWIFLYFTLLISPFCLAFHQFPWRQELFIARRALGLSACYYSLLHAVITFWGQLDGIAGISFLAGSYLIAILLGAIALLIFVVLSVSANDTAVRKLGFRWWKYIHRFVYAASILILIHAFLIGTHFQDLGTALPIVCFVFLTLLLLLEGQRADFWMRKKLKRIYSFGPITLLVATSIALGIGFVCGGPGVSSISIHGNHGGGNQTSNSPAVYDHHGNLISGGTPLIRHVNVNLKYPNVLRAQEPIEITLVTSDADTGIAITNFRVIHEKLMHLIVVDDALEWFDHIHPILIPDKGFVITETFPKPGKYRLYAEFQPQDAAAQAVVLSLEIPDTHAKSTQATLDTIPIVPRPDLLTSEVGAYRMTLVESSTSTRNSNSSMPTFTLNIENTAVKAPLNIQPWLGSFGHMIIVNTQTYHFYHLHAESTPKSTDNSETLTFSGLGTSGRFDAGLYKIFVQVQIDGKVLLSNFDWNIK